MKRPMLYWAVLFVLGVVVYKIFSISGAMAFLFAVIATAVVVMAVFRCQNNAVTWIGVLFFCMGWICIFYQTRQLLEVEDFCGEKVTVEGVLLRRDVKHQKTEYTMKTKNINGRKIYTKLVFYYDGDVMLGSRVVVQGEGKGFSRATNPGQYDEKAYCNGTGIYLKLVDVSVQQVEMNKFEVRQQLEMVHVCLKENYENLFDKEYATLACAMVLGDKASVDADIKHLYQRNGIAHLIAISGLHIAMIGGVLYQILRKCMGSYGVAAGLGVGFIVAYGLMTGLSESTLRAMIMLVTQIGADVFGRKYDSVTAISLALLGMLFCNPNQITQAGFLLSFTAVIGIAVVYPSWSHLFGELPYFWNGLLLSVSVQLTILPILLYYFYEIPVYGFLLNLIVVPLMSFLLIFLLLCGLLYFWCQSIAGLLVVPAKYIFSFYEFLCNCSEELPFHSVCSGKPAIGWIVCYYMLLAAVVWTACHMKKGRAVILLLAGMGMLGLFAFFWMPTDMKICMFDVGQGDGIYIRTPERFHILMDGGSSSQQKVGTYILKNGLKYYGANCIDYVFVSHMDSDHYSGIKELLETKEITIRNLVLPKIANPDEAYRELEYMSRQAGCKLIYFERGNSIQIGTVKILCLNPSEKYYGDKNEGCLVFQINYKEFDLLLTGDITKKVEREIYPYIKESIELLKVSHHGSNTASGEDFIEGLSPELALISVGEGNRYGHPSPEVLKILEKHCEKIYLTKDSGAITIDTDGRYYGVREFLRNGVE